MTVVIFSANDGVHGPELWRTDGTAAGTYLLADIDPRAGGSNLTDFVVDDGVAYFSAYDGTSNELWRSDGTVAGTFALSAPADGADPTQITAVGAKIFYLGDDTAHGAGLFVTDGAAGGTSFVASVAGVTDLTAFGNELAFNANGQIWLSDGTSAGTHALSVGASGNIVGAENGELFFESGQTLWVTNGTAGGTVELAQSDIWLQYEAAAAGGNLYFENTTPGSPGPGNTFGDAGLFVTNGTVAGTTLILPNVAGVEDITQVGHSIIFMGDQSNTVGLYVSNGAPSGTAFVAAGTIVSAQAASNGEIYFGFLPTGGAEQVWISDGTLVGTHVVYAPPPEETGGVGGVADLGRSAVFDGSTDGFNIEPWISNSSGTDAHQILDIQPAFDASVTIVTALAFGGKLVFSADVNGVPDSLYVTDGTAAGTAPLLSHPPGDNYGTISSLTVVGADLFFTVGAPSAPANPGPPTPDEGGGDGDGITAFANSGGGIGIGIGGAPELGAPANGLWVSEGAPGDAVLLTAAFGGGGTPIFLTPFDGALYFEDNYYNGIQGGAWGLFRSDGTVAGTVLVSQVAIYDQPVVLGDELLFYGDGAAGVGLYASDGTSGGLTLLAATPFLTDPTVSGSKAFFEAYSTAAGEELWVTDGTAAGTSMVEDIAPGATSSDPSQLTAFDGGVIFTADDQTHGVQVWFSDGTAAGTELLDINTTSNSVASLYVYSAVSFDGKAYFVGNDGVHGDQLWSSDGTLAGTTVVAQLSNGSGPDANFFTVLNGKLFFVDQGNAWVSDGTTAGTVELSGAYGQLNQPVVLDGKVYFWGNTVASPQFSDGLYVTDGTDAGTHLIFADGNSLFAAGHNLFFFGDDQTDGAGIFAYNDVTATTTLVKSVPDFENSGALGVAVGSEFFFGLPGSSLGSQLWATDGTAAGTVLLATAPPSSEGFTDLASFDGSLYFVSEENSPGLWVSNGTSAGTTEVSTLQVQGDLTPVGGKLYFVATDAAHGSEVWSYDPVAGVASLVVDATPGSTGSSPGDITAASGGVYFVANDATSAGELWFVNGAGAVSELTSPANGEVLEVLGNAALTAIGANLFFAGSDSVHGEGLFETNGSQVTFLAPVTINDPLSFSVVGSLLYFQGYDAVNGSELWVSDGTTDGTHPVTGIQSPNSANASQFTVADGQVFFSATDGVHGQELWAFSGSPGSAHMIADLNPGAGDSDPTDLTPFDGVLYFVASNGVASELWRTDGTAGGTTAVTSPTDGGTPQFLTLDGDKLFFYGSDSVHGSGLFVTDGTAAGTSFLLTYSLPASTSSGFTVVDGDLYFNGPNSAGGTELWMSDGTVGGTVAVGDVTVDYGSNPSGFTPLASVATNDFNGGGVSDLLIENGAGAVVVGQVVGGQAAYSQVAGLGPEWSFEGTGDFLAHGDDQFLIENSAGAVDVGEIVSGQAVYSQVAGLGPEWTFVGTGDFLGHGDDQFLIENSAGAVVVGEVVSGHAAYTQVAGLGPEWKFVGAGDFLGDGKSDFLIENTSGVVVVGEVANGQAAYTQVAGLGPEWKFVGTGDFLGDGKSDFLIENTSGAVVVGEVANGQATYTQIAGLGPEWKFVGAGDFLGEGHDQFLIENTSGVVVVGDWTGGQIHYTDVASLGPEWLFHL